MNIKKMARIVVVGVSMSIVSACTTLSPTATQNTPVSATNEKVFNKMGRFALLVVDSVSGKPVDSVQGGFNWSDDGDKLTLDLTNPLGSVLARVEVSSGRSVLTRSNGEIIEAYNPEELVAKVVGTPMPVSDLRKWLKGQVDSTASNRVKSDGSDSFSQNGWNVTLSDYMANTTQPSRLVLKRTISANQITIRLVLDQ